MNKNPYTILMSSLVILFSTIMARADFSYSNAVMALNPVAYWPLEETNQPPPRPFATNEGTAGSAYNGAYSGVITLGATGALAGDSDTAASFTGNGIVDVPFASKLSIQAPFSVEVWANGGGTSAQACIVSAGHFGSPRAGWLLYNNVGSLWDFRLYNQNGTALSLELPSGGTADTNWHHIVAVFDGVNGTLYVDGAPVAGPTAATGYVPDPDGDLNIGQRSDGSFQFTGGIDEVAIYTNALSASDIAAHYSNGTNTAPSQSYSSLVLADKPEFYYRLDQIMPVSTAMAQNYGSFGSIVNGTYLPGSFPAASGPKGVGFGPASLACNFNPSPIAGGGGYVDCTTNSILDITGPITVIAWVKGAPADTTNRFQSFLGRSDQSWRADFGTPGVPPDGAARFADGSNPDAFGQTFINDGNWHFFAGIYDGSANTYVYIDGAPDGTNTAGGVTGNPTADMLIGGVGDYIPARLFDGSVAQVAVFTNALSASQIQTLYFAGELAPSISQQPQSITIGLGDSGSVATKVNGNPTLAYQWYQGTTKLTDVPGNISGSTSTTLTITNAQLSNGGNYTLVATNNFGSATSAVAVVTITPSPDITQEPQSNSLVYAGNVVPLHIAAIGASPLSYQWYKGPSAIGGATSSNLPLSAVVGTNSYYCIVTNSFGSATSTLATVIAQTFVLPAGGFVVNFDAFDGTPADNFTGQGAYNDPGNNIWNPIGNPGTTTSLAFGSASNQTLVTATLIYGFNNSGIGQAGAGQTQGNPSWLLSTEDAVNGNSPGIGTPGAPEGQLTINDLPQGTYTVYLYAENYDGTRGSIFSIAATNGGAADQGIVATDPSAQAGFSGSDSTSYAEGVNYVFFTNVVADATGAIRLTYVYNPAPDLLQGEAPFDGVQVIQSSVPVVPPTMSIQASGGQAIISWLPPNGVLQSALSVTGTYGDIIGSTSPYTNPISGPQQFFRVRIGP